MTNRIVYVSGPADQICGSIKMVFRHAEELRAAGFNACVATPDGRPPARIANSAAVIPLTELSEGKDILVLPDRHAGFLRDFARWANRKLVFCQQPLMIHHGLAGPMDYAEFGVRDLICTGETAAAFCRRRLPAHRIHVIPFCVDTSIFRPRSPKHRQIAFMAQDGSLPVAAIRDLFRAENPAERDMPWIELNDLSEADAALILGESAWFLSSGPPEVSPLLPIEALASGCLVAGFTGFGGSDYMTDRNGFWAPCGDCVACAEMLLRAVRLVAEDVSLHRQRMEEAVHTAVSYSPTRFQERLIAVWRTILEQDVAGAPTAPAAVRSLAAAAPPLRALTQAAPAETGDPAEAALRRGLHQAGRKNIAGAVAAFREAVRLRPDLAQAHHNLGVALAEQGQQKEAAASFRQALVCKPDYPEASFNLGHALSEVGDREEAVTHFCQAIQTRPHYAEAYNQLGITLVELKKPEAAEIYLRQAVNLRPEFTEALNNLGNSLMEQGRLAEAQDCFERALRLNALYAPAHTNLGNALKEQGKLQEALASYQISLWLDPDSATTHWNRSLALLQMGNYEQGWVEYEWRWKRKRSVPRPLPQPRWDGSSLTGRTIFLYTEQGLGDTIQFLRYCPLVKDRGGTVFVECPGFLIPLFSSCAGIDRLIPEGAPLPPFDVQAPLLSLPEVFRSTLSTLPARVPYLSVPEELVRSWSERLAHWQGFKVGTCWQGNPHHPWDRHRSIPLTQFRPLTDIPGVHLFSLQKGTGTEQLHSSDQSFPVADLMASELDNDPRAFLETAAIIKNLDLVITADTAVAHLAGALGAPVWLALATIVDWRWLLRRQTSPWYPTMRLFRQARLGDWSTVFTAMAVELQRLTQRQPSVTGGPP